MKREFYPADSVIGRAIIKGREAAATSNVEMPREADDWLLAEKVRQLVSGAIISRDPGWAVKEICRMFQEARE